MSFEYKFSKYCRENGLTICDYDGWYIFVRFKDGLIKPITETTALKWIENKIK